MSGERQRDVVYLDSSALVKLVIAESESAALSDYLRGRPIRVSCALALVEVPRAVGRHGDDAKIRAQDVLERIQLLTIDNILLSAAADLPTSVLRSLDAIHLAAALSFGENLEALVTYDRRMIHAAEAIGMRCVVPA